MRKYILIALAVLAGASLNTAEASKKDKKGKKNIQAAETLRLENTSDSISYAAGMARTEGLMEYLKQQFGVDGAHLADFICGYEDAVKQNTDDRLKAYSAGEQIAIMVNSRMIPFLRDEFKGSNDSIDSGMFHKGFIAALKKDNSVMADSTAKAYFDNEVKANLGRMNEGNRKAGEKFLAENKTKEGVKTMASGLQYKILTQGTGKTPKATDEVVVKYEGRLVDGTVFDSSYKRNPQTSTFRANQVIKGWTEALTMMPAGSTWELYIPYSLGYGERQAGNLIKPYSALIFKVELVEVK